MTCIAAIVDPTSGKVWMGADTRMSRGNASEYHAGSKIWKATWSGETLLFGAAGSQPSNQVLRYLAPLPKKDFAGGDDFVSYMVCNWIPQVRKAYAEQKAVEIKEGSLKSNQMVIIGRGGKLYLMDSGFGFTQISMTRMAIGSGGAYAHGFLNALKAEGTKKSPRKQLRLAIAGASEFCDGVGGRIDILTN